MSRNGSGVYSLPAGNPVVTNTTISSTWANNTLADMSTALTGSIAADGQTTITGNLQMNSNKLTGLAVGTVNGDSVEYSQLVGLLVNPTLSGDVTMSGTAFVLIPKGTTAQRPSVPVAGEMRYNTDTNQFEGYANGVWGQLGGGATGAGGDEVFQENSLVVTTDYTLTTGKNAISAGPIQIDSGVEVTIPTGQRWIIL